MRKPLARSTLILMAIGASLLWIYFPLIQRIVTPYIAPQYRSLSSLVPESPMPVSRADVLSFPRLGIDAPLELTENIDPFQLGDWQVLEQSLRRGVGLIYAGNRFATAPIAYIVGHSSDAATNPYAFIFAGLRAVKAGDVFSVTQHGQQYDYTVVHTEIVRPNDRNRFTSLERTESGRQRVLLVTCWPLFTNTNRLVVVGERLL